MANAAYLSRTPSSAGNRRTFTYSTWFKRTNTEDSHFGFSAGTPSNATAPRSYGYIYNNQIWSGFNPSGSQWYDLQTNAYYRDVNAWYHIVVAVDTTQATASDRHKLYVNGERVTSFATEQYVPQNTDLSINNTLLHTINAYAYNVTGYATTAVYAHTHFCDGTQYQASDFGETDATTGIWKPKTAPSVTYGTNGFFLKFENSGSMGTDSSGNGNNFTVNGTLTQTLDTPSNVYATMNPLLKGANVSLSNGNLTCVGSGTYVAVGSTLAVNTGKWYWEAECNAASPHNRFNVGLMKTSINQNGLVWPGASSDGYVYANDGYIYTNGSQILDTGTTVSVGDIVGFLLDLDNGTLKLKKNGSDVYSGNAVISSLNTGDYWYVAQGADVSNVDFNFGNGYFGTSPVSSAGSNGNGAIFEHDVPTGYYALNTKNINTYG